MTDRRKHYDMPGVQIGVATVTILAFRCAGCEADFHIDKAPGFCPFCGRRFDRETSFGDGQGACGVPEPISEDWLRSAGFKWHQFDRQENKHWLLWLGDAVGKGEMFTCFEDIGIEVTRGRDDTWFCWFRSDTAGRYHRFLHVRHIATQVELIALAEAITGQQWNPANNLYGAMHTPERGATLRENAERLDIKMRARNPKWSEVEKDDSRGRALPEHMESAEKARTEKKGN